MFELGSSYHLKTIRKSKKSDKLLNKQSFCITAFIEMSEESQERLPSHFWTFWSKSGKHLVILPEELTT